MDFSPHVPRSLAKRASQLLQASLQRDTRSSYHTAVYGPNGYVTVLVSFGVPEADLWPASTANIGSWLSWLLMQNLHSGSSYVSGLRDAHVEAGLAWMASEQEQLILTKLRKGYLRSLPPKENNSKRAFPITPLHIRAFARDQRVWDAPEGINFLAAHACASYAASRGGELFSFQGKDCPRSKTILVKHLKFMHSAHGMIITLPFDKTHQAHTVDLWFPELPGDETCPVALVKEMIEQRRQRRGRDDRPDEPLFQSNNGSHLVFSKIKQWTFAALYRLGLFIPEDSYLGLKMWRRGHTSAFESIPPAIYDALRRAGRWAGKSHQCYSTQSLSKHIFALAEHSAQALDGLDSDAHIGELLNPDTGFNISNYERSPPFLFAPLVIPADSDWAKGRNARRALAASGKFTGPIKITRLSTAGLKKRQRRAQRSSISPPPLRRSSSASAKRSPPQHNGQQKSATSAKRRRRDQATA
jgi:hypothetical protein